MKLYKKIFSTVLLVIAVLCIFAALVLGAGYALQYFQAEQVVENLRPDEVSPPSTTESIVSSEQVPENTDSFEVAESKESVDSSASSESTDSNETPAFSENTTPGETDASAGSSASSQPASSEEPILTEHPYKESFLANDDMAAWLVIPGTNIDYPVMWTPEDENYYLYRDFDGKDNVNGSLILDTDSCLDPLTTNQIIHGHNMKSGAMFGNLTDYEDPDYGAKHNLITLYTKDCQRNYEVIAVFRSQVYKKTDTVFKFYKFFQADSEEEFLDFYENIKELSLYDTGVTAQFGDRFLTLSTCVYHVTNGRFVVVAKEIEPGDSYLPME